MGDNKCRSAFHKSVHSLLNKFLSSCIYRTCSLIKDKCRWVCNCRTCYCQKLSLSLTQVCTVTGEHCVVSVRKSCDKAVCICKFCCLYDFLVCRIKFTVLDVFPYCSGKQMCVLQNDTKRAS